jgi:hypothetical protein
MTAITNRHQSHARINRILEVGIGWGKYGVLMREYLGKQDIMEEEDFWKLNLEAVEISYQYTLAFKNKLYSRIYNMDIRDFCKEIDTWLVTYHGWDLIMFIDIIEHLPKEDGVCVLETLLEKSFWLMMVTPKRLVPQPVQLYHNNEQHVSLWNIDDFSGYEIDEVVIDNTHSLGLMFRGKLYQKRPPKR